MGIFGDQDLTVFRVSTLGLQGSYMKEYLDSSNAKLKQLMYVMNPNKLRCVEFLVRFHEERGDKVRRTRGVHM